MRFYEIHEPYYALIRAQNGGEATQVYIDVVSGEENEFYDIHQGLNFIEKSVAERKINELFNGHQLDEIIDSDLIDEQIKRLLNGSYPEIILMDGSLK